MSISAYISVLVAIIVPIAAITVAYMAYHAEREADALRKRAMALASEASRLALLAIESVASSRASRLAEASKSRCRCSSCSQDLASRPTSSVRLQ